MRRNYLKALSIVLYVICAVSTALLVLPQFTVLSYSHGDKFISGFIIFALGFLASRLRCIGKNDECVKKIMHRTMIWFFLTYILIVIDFTLISDSFGRNLSSIFILNKAEINEHIKRSTNFIPFNTIRLYINAYLSGSLQFYIIIENLLGNLLVFAPLAILAPTALRSINTLPKFLLFIGIFVVIIEIMQFVFLTGSADIDDLILNMIGALIGYGVVSINSVRSALIKIGIEV